MIPIKIEGSTSLEIFKNKIFKWEPIEFGCKLWQDFLYRIGYVKVVANYFISCP